MSKAASPLTRLIVFSDDWGRHPSSCQHLVRHLMEDHEVMWVNTIGTRRPTLSVRDMRKVLSKLKSWTSPMPQASEADHDDTKHPEVISPLMYPGFRKQWQRHFNAARISKQVNQELGPRQANEKRVVISTLPITADLIQMIDADRWIYYAVDDFSVWPGMDQEVMDRMERELVQQVDQCIAVSDNIQRRLRTMGVEATLLTHGIDLKHWNLSTQQPNGSVDFKTNKDTPEFLFWGVIDQRLDLSLLREFTEQGQVILAGPQDHPPLELKAFPNTKFLGPVPYDDLPALATKADILIMPYADLPVTRAMQPLKFNEYLATCKPVISRRLPAIAHWEEAACLIEEVEQITEAIQQCHNSEILKTQLKARERLKNESWKSKAAQFRECL